MKWVNIKTRKPPMDTEVLVFQRFRYGTHIKIAEYVRPFDKKRPVFGVDIRREKSGYVYGGFPLDNITHWMPLPEPPQYKKPREVSP